MAKNSKNTAVDGFEIQSQVNEAIGKFKSKVNEEIYKSKAEFQDHLTQFTEIQAKQGEDLTILRANLTMLHSKFDGLNSKFDDVLRAIKESYGPSAPISMVADKLLASNDPDPGVETTAENRVEEELETYENGRKSEIKHSYVEEKPNQSLVDASICVEGSEPEQIEAFISTTSFASTVKEQVNDDPPVFGTIAVQNGASKLFAEMSESILEEDMLGIEGTKVVHHLFDEMPGPLSVKLDSEIDGYKDLRLLVIDFLGYVGYEDVASRIIFDPGGSFLYHINYYFCNSNGDKHDFDFWIDKLNAELTDTWAFGCIHFLVLDVVNANFITLLDLPIIVGPTREGMECYEEAIGENSRIKMRAVAFTSLLDALSKNGKFDEALKLFDRMLKEHVPPRRLTVNLRSYNVIVDGYCTWGKFHDAIQVFNTMDDKVMNPDEYTFVTLMNTCFKENRPDDAAAYYWTMVESKLWPNLGIYNRLMDGLVKVGKVDEAKLFFDMMVRKRMMNDDAYIFLTNVLFEVCKHDEVPRILGRMLRKDPADFTPELENFVWDPSQCTLFVYILEDKDVLKRKGIGVRLALKQDKWSNGASANYNAYMRFSGCSLVNWEFLFFVTVVRETNLDEVMLQSSIVYSNVFKGVGKENSNLRFLEKHMRASFEKRPQHWVTNITVNEIHSGDFIVISKIRGRWGAFETLEKWPACAANMWNEALNKKLGTQGLALPELLVEVVKRGSSFGELLAIPEQDDWVYIDGKSTLCVAFVLEMYKEARLSGQLANSIEVTEFTIKDIFAGSINGWYYADPRNTLVYWIQKHIFKDLKKCCNRRLNFLFYVAAEESISYFNLFFLSISLRTRMFSRGRRCHDSRF